MNQQSEKACKSYFMLDYMKKRARKIDVSLLRYAGAFSEGVTGKPAQPYKDGCPKLLRAYEDGARMRRKGLTAIKVDGSIRKH